MIVVIDSECSTVPEGCIELKSQGMALLNMLNGLGYASIAPPLAELLKQHYQLEGDWAVVSPMRWEASHNDAVIVATGRELSLSEADSLAWFKVFADFFAEDHMILHYHSPELWLVRIDNKPSLNAKPVYQILHKSLMPELSELDKTLYWQKFFTESQMLLAAQPNDTDMNGIWVWGNGALEPKKSLAVCVDEVFYSLAELSVVHPKLYNPSVALKDYQLLVLNKYDHLSDAHKEELKQGPVTWYWNNCAYTNPKTNWFKRLWRNLFHAY